MIILVFGKLKRWSTLLIIAIIAVITAVLIYVIIFNSNNVKALSNQSTPKVETATATKPQNTDSADKTGSSTSSSTNNGVNSVSVSTAPSGTQASGVQSTNYKEFFKDDAFFGDSISEGLFFYDFLDENRVVAEKGLSITKGIDEADKIIALKPKRVFILFGVNDIDDRTPSSRLVDQYTTLVVKLKTGLPDSRIYVTSILPVLENIVKNPHINNAHIKECNSGLMNMAVQQNVNYINLASLLNDHNINLYEDDGIHYKSDFYGIWLNYLESIVK